MTLPSPGGWWEVCDGFGDYKLWMSAHGHKGDPGTQDRRVGMARMWGSITALMSQCTRLCLVWLRDTPHLSQPHGQHEVFFDPLWIQGVT